MKNLFLFAALMVVAACTTDDGEFNASEDCPVSARGTFVDERDGQIYKYTTIGDQVWMAQNLNYHFVDSLLEDPYEYNEDRKKGIYTSDCYYPEDSCAEKGLLYTWVEAYYGCPAGWHVPSENEWRVLFDKVGGIDNATEVLKSSSGWKSLNPGDSANGNDACGLNIYPAIYGSMKDGFGAGIWAISLSTYVHGNGVYMNFLSYKKEVYVEDVIRKRATLSVRCLKN